MTCSEPGDGVEGQPTEAEMLADGWERCFVADEPRLSEAVETYREIGFEVRLLPVPLDDEACTDCMAADPDRYRLIYVRQRT
ncbi:MAG: hypothetical protein JRJ84_19995 [Deltaproteobacteria bacterium]|nr:hypothetical protein [Deltaproteobacteria bacterium]